MMSRVLGGCLCLTLFHGSISSVSAQAPAPADLARIVEQSVAAYTKALAGSDPKAVGVLFTTEAEYIDDEGVIFHGRAAIEAEFEAVQKVRPKGQVAIEVISVRPIGNGLLAEDGISTFTPEDDGARTTTRYSAIHARQGEGKWLIASLRELADVTVDPHEQLKALSFLLGRWRQEANKTTIDTEWTWSADGKFLNSQITVRQPNGTENGGTHRIGWDAERKQFRSWLFETDGSFGEGYWTRSADGWVLKLEILNTEGARQSTALSYVTDGKDALVVSVIPEADVSDVAPISIRLVRQPPAPSKSDSSR